MAKYKRILIVLILLVILFMTKAYYSELISSQLLQNILSQNGISKMLSLLETLISVYTITEIINLIIQKNQKQDMEEFLSKFQTNQKEFLDNLTKLIEVKNIKKGIIGFEECPQIADYLYKYVYKSEIIRYRNNVTLTFDIDENSLITQEMESTYELYNRTNKKIVKTIKISTIDRDEKVVMTSFKYYRNNQEFKEIPIKNNNKNVYSVQEYELVINPHEKINIIQDFKINLGIPAGFFYQNTIGFNEITIDLYLKINKPIGYLFAVELYSKEPINYTENILDDFDNINKASLTYSYSGAILPGTALEYSLEKY